MVSMDRFHEMHVLTVGAGTGGWEGRLDPGSGDLELDATLVDEL